MEIQVEADARKIQTEADKELALKELELQAQAQVNIDATSNPPPPNRDAKSQKLPALVDEKDELDSYFVLNVIPKMPNERKSRELSN